MTTLIRNLITSWCNLSLVARIVIGLVIGLILGLTSPSLTGISILGTLFVGALKSIAPVLVAVLVASAIAKAQTGLGPRFRMVITLYLLTTFLAGIVAVVGSMAFPVRLSLSNVITDTSAAPEGLAEIFKGLARGMVSNPIAAVSEGNYICVLFWAVIIGLALKKHASEQTILAVSDFADVISQAVRWVIQMAPFGILGLVFTSVSESGIEIFTTYGWLVAVLLGCMFFMALVVNPLVVFLFLRKNPYPLVWRCLKESGLNAFFTRSSAANIPINMALCKKMDIETDFYSVSIPLGATINMEGAAITITVISLATCHTLGISVTFPTAIVLSILATLAACGTSGVAGGSLLLIPLACSLFGISTDIAMQAVAIGFIIGVVQDSVETALNSSSDALFTITAELFNREKQDKAG